MSTSHPPVLDASECRLTIPSSGRRLPSSAWRVLSMRKMVIPSATKAERALGHLLTDQTHGLVFKIEAPSP